VLGGRLERGFDTCLGCKPANGVGREVINGFQIFNRKQEKHARDIIFDTLFSQKIIQRGFDPADVWRLGPKKFLEQIVPGSERDATARWLTQTLTNSVQGALEQTFAASTEGKLGRWLMSTYEKFPLAALVHPFPRFLANSMKFLRDHSPFGIARFATERQRAVIAKAFERYGDKQLFNEAIQNEAVEAIGKMMTGYTLLAGAIGIRNSDMAGERWYEINVGNRVIDARPFNPLAAYLLLGEQMRRIADPDATGAPIKGRDYAEAFAGIRRFTGTGLFVFHLFDQDVDRFTKGIQRTAAEMIGGFTVPFRTIKDFLATVKEDEGITRAGREAGLFGPALANLPLLGTALLPETQRATREEPVGAEAKFGPLAAPTFRQLTGIIARERTPVEAEAIRLDVFPGASVGDERINRLIDEEMGPDVGRKLNRLVQSPRYRRLDDVDKKERLSAELGKIRTQAKGKVIRRERGAIVDQLVSELGTFSQDRQRRELRRRRNAGLITAEMERTILRRLRRTR
jgi:hypothetical protein